MDLKFIREHVDEGRMVVTHIPTSERRMNTLTEALQPKEFEDQHINLVSCNSLD